MGMEVRDRKYVAMVQGSLMSAGWQFRNLILGLDCCRVATLTVCFWPNGDQGRVQLQRPNFDSRLGRIYISLSILISLTLCWIPMMGEVEDLIWLIGVLAMLQLKPWSTRGVSHQPVLWAIVIHKFLGRGISLRFHLAVYMFGVNQKN